MIHIVVPMAGAGSRFSKAGYTDPKPLINVHKTPMIEVVIDNLTPQQPHKFIFICQREHAEKYALESKLSVWAPGCDIVIIDGLTEGAACTVLKAKHLINNDNPLMIANSDQYVAIDVNDYLAHAHQSDTDGCIMTMKADDPKWSFIGLDEKGAINRVVEKQVISDEATVGIYNFKSGQMFVDAAEAMIGRNERVNNEFYVAPTYNTLIADGKKIAYYNIGSVEHGMYGLGTPDDLNHFLQLPISQKFMKE